MAKHKLVRNLTMVGAVVVSASFLFNSCSNEEIDKFLTFSNANNNVATEEIVDEIYCHNFSRVTNDFMFNILLKKHFAKKDQSNITLTNIEVNGQKKTFLRFQEICSYKNIPEFLNNLNKYYNIEVLQIDSATLWQLNDYSFSFINTLVLNCDSKGVGICDLSNFKRIDNLILKNVRATNIPKNIQSISYDGMNNDLYLIDELDNIKDFLDLKSLIFKNLTLNNITIPKSADFLIEFTNCKGYINVNVTDSHKLYIDNNTTNKFSCFVEVNGKINEELNVYSTYNNVVTGELKGKPNLFMTIQNGKEEYTRTIESVEEYRLKLERHDRKF